MRAAIVCGPREGTGIAEVCRALDIARRQAEVPRFDYITVGSHRGTDKEAFEWAMLRELPAFTVPAKWKTGKFTGPAEGPERNRQMHGWVQPVAVLGFPGGTGTSDMMSVGAKHATPSLWWSAGDELWILDERCAVLRCPGYNLGHAIDRGDQ